MQETEKEIRRREREIIRLQKLYEQAAGQAQQWEEKTQKMEQLYGETMKAFAQAEPRTRALF